MLSFDQNILSLLHVAMQSLNLLEISARLSKELKYY